MKKIKTIVFSLAIIFSVFYLIAPTTISDEVAPPPTLYVGGDEVDSYDTIQDAVDNATEPATIYVYNGTYYENIVVNKLIWLEGENKETTIIDGSGFGNVVTIAADRVSISGFTIQNGQKIDWIEGGYAYLAAGVLINSNESTVVNNIFLNNTFGIKILGGVYNHIESNLIKENGDGIWMSGLNNSIIGNNITENNQNFIWAEGKATNIGITLNSANYNQISHNSISNHIGDGINVSLLSKNNEIYKNNFIGNVVNAFDDSNNSWDNGEKGNYWSDYNGTDETYDKIGDAPYLILGGDNKDNYPLMEPYAGEYEFIVDEGSLYQMLIIGMAVAIVFLLPIAYLWYKKHHKK